MILHKSGPVSSAVMRNPPRELADILEAGDIPPADAERARSLAVALYPEAGSLFPPPAA